MQINGAQLTIAFSPKSSELQNAPRTPITIEAKSAFKLADEAASLAKLKSQSDQQQTAVDDSQQAQFIRLLATDNAPSFQPEPTSLPASVQQYLQISEQPSASRLFDETV